MTDTEVTEPTPIRRRGPRKGPRKAVKRSPRRRATVSPDGLVGGLRAQLAEQVKECPTCHQTTGNKSLMAREMGVSIMTLNKFLDGGEVRSSTVDAVYAYLNKSK